MMNYMYDLYLVIILFICFIILFLDVNMHSTSWFSLDPEELSIILPVIAARQ